MAALTLDALAARLELLERENARLNRATRCLKMWLGMILTLGLGAVSAGAALQQQPSPITPELRTERLVVVDRLGRSRVELSVGVDGKASLNFLDKAQKSRLTLATMPDGLPTAEFNDQLDKTRLSMSVDAFGPPSLMLADQNGHPRILRTSRPPVLPRSR